MPHGNGLRVSPETSPPYFPHDPCTADPELSAIVDAWPSLPEAVKAGIVAMVDACKRS